MNDNERDERLGAALRQLDVPDHAPGFWDDLAGRLSDDAPGPVVRLDQERTRRRRFVPLAAAAAVVAALLGAGVVIGDKNNADPGRRVVADRPPAVAAAPAMVTIAFADKGVPESGAAGNSVLTVAQDGSYRWTSADGIVDIAYDAEAGRVVQSADPEDRKVAYIFTDLAPGGPDAPVPVTEPLGPLGDFVVSLARAGNKQVTEATHAGTGREVWRYDGPVAADRLSGGMSPDHVLAEVDRETGVVLTMHSTISGRAFQNLDATKIETHETVDRSRFTFPADPNGTSTFSRGFKPMSPEEAADAVPYPILVPEDVPDGFVLDAVAVNQKVPMGTGAEGMNPPVANVVSMRWSKGYLSFSVTLRPVDGQVWDDPFGREGRVFRKIPLKVALEGRPPLEGDLVVDGGTHPHFWGITRDIVVTADGDLTAQEFLRLAESLRG
ncbi:MAG: hypothetical protein ACRDZ3_17070 [Acidimicrobiia bacterium]